MEKEAEKSTNGVDEVDKWAAERMDRYESDCLYRQRIIRRPKQVDYLDDTPINMGLECMKRRREYNDDEYNLPPY